MRLDASRNGGDVAFRTSFSDGYDLVQVLHGLTSVPGTNSPVDFRLAALQRKGHPDIWHMDQVLAFSTDECSPMVVNGEDIGGNHGHPCAVRVTVPDHGKDVRDVGSLWQDEGGVRWTLLRVESADRLLLLSENIGPSVTDYDFVAHVDGVLRYVENGLHGEAVIPQNQQSKVQLTPAIRHIQRDALCLRDGCWREIGGCEEGCECAEIREVYEIVNQATVAPALRAGRPPEGYAVQPSLAVGETMLLHRMTYRILADGAILCDFDHQLAQDVRMSYYLGSMHQEKCDVYGGGVWRYIPKVKPFEYAGRVVDFSRPYRTTADTLPDYRPLTPDLWMNPASPPDRQIDFICRQNGSAAVGFASGFLPVHDGRPEHRAASITDAAMLVKSCKTYPTFAGGATCEGSFPRVRGVAYKKYFLPQGDGASMYTVSDGEDTYLYMDFFAHAEKCMKYEISPARTAELLEASIPCQQTRGCVEASGSSGYAVFCLRSQERKD